MEAVLAKLPAVRTAPAPTAEATIHRRNRRLDCAGFGQIFFSSFLPECEKTSANETKITMLNTPQPENLLAGQYELKVCEVSVSLGYVARTTGRLHYNLASHVRVHDAVIRVRPRRVERVAPTITTLHKLHLSRRSLV